MIQFNLLPDVKLDFIKARRAKRLVILSSLIVSGISIGICVFLFLGVGILQKKHLADLNNDINRLSNQLKNEQDIDKILTVQNQLNSLDELHDKKPAAVRLGGYLSQITPSTVSISSLDVDFAANTMNISGSAVTLKNVNEFIDTMKFTTYKIMKEDKTGPAFSKVVLSSFSRSDGDTSSGATTYEISLAFDPLIFDTTKDAQLNVPANKITTRSVTERPEPLFDQQPKNDSGGGQ